MKKTILITGTSRGLGRAMTAEFVRLGHTVIGCGRDKSAIARLKKQYGPPHRFDVVDVTDDAAVKHWAKAVLAEYAPPDLLLNNAALINPLAPLWEVPQQAFDAVIDVNIKGVANVIRHFVPAMVAKKHGVICNFSSGWGRSTDAQVAPYCASKWAIEGLTQALAQELPRGMAAIPLSPGIINTDMLKACFGTDAAAYPTAEEWAEDAVPWLLKLGPRDNGRSLTIGD
ncbi:NADP-dependent 3-hydroxy acid dehydrogenase YdfG [Sulfuritortus calidifontis]|uniref:NADP-dependent 3-hydroxy acid dehydrogenase YdfG n=1 Tax=Sulfuritortus calidifontis TaxID=1914471 RepID=A0A4R3JRL4_9PROT|nr:SDR family NAD(P)-dependent oxidoreductase [Sulfuritortus calidifontis]TCS69705.1 NADP-dependent 3-hydroxy acid dehydrogenase YdfG [Sulfuritortus calidifontis]